MIFAQIHSSIEELKESLSADILPKEYGGVVPLSEMIGTNIFDDLSYCAVFFFRLEHDAHVITNIFQK